MTVAPVEEAPPPVSADAVETEAAAASAAPPPLLQPQPSADEKDASAADAAVAHRWATLLSAARAEAQAAFLLRQVGACPRCCLRFAGVREASAYAPPAPSGAALLAALVDEKNEAATTTTAEAAATDAAVVEATCSVCLGVLQAPDGTEKLPLPSERMVAAASAVDMGAGEWFPLSRGDGAAVAGVVEREGHCRSTASDRGEETRSTSAPFSSFRPPPSPRVVSLQVSFPASVGLRQASASAALSEAGLPSAKPTASDGRSGIGSLGPDSITDVKDALKAAVAPSLSSSLSEGRGGSEGGEGKEAASVVTVTTANDADAAALTVSMMFVHPPTAHEIELVPGLAGKKRSRGWAGVGGGRGKSVFVVEEQGGGRGGAGGRGEAAARDGDGGAAAASPPASLPPGNKGHWKKRKRVPAADAASLGRAASQAVTQACSRLDGSRLRSAGFPVPPPRLARSAGDASPSARSTMPHVLVRARSSPLYLGGRYLKLERDVSQSPFFDERGRRRGRTSVQEEIERHVLPLFGSRSTVGGGGGCDGMKFITAGREDLDVRCLGRGRPFILEVSNSRLRGLGPPTQEALDGARKTLRDARCGVELAALAVVGRRELSAIKEGESAKQKSYEALCWLPREVDDGVIASINGAVSRAVEQEKERGRKGGANGGAYGKDDVGWGLVLKQTTPSRVEHRRAMLVRERSIVEMSASKVPGEPQQLVLRLRTQAGLYVKEFVHGDDGRTTPSLIDVARPTPSEGEGKKEGEAGDDAGRSDAAAAAPAARDDEVEPAKCLSLDVREVHLDFL